MLTASCKAASCKCVQEVWESCAETLDLPYGDDAAPCSGQLSRTLSPAAGKQVSNLKLWEKTFGLRWGDCCPSIGG